MNEMTKREFEKIYCLHCEMCADCTRWCAAYHECKDDKDPGPAITKIVNKMIDCIRAMSEAEFQVVAVRISNADTSIHLDSVDVVKRLSRSLGVDLYEDAEGARIHFANVEIYALYW